MRLCSSLTFGFDLQRGPHQREEGGVEGDRPVGVQRHVHGDQPLRGEEGESFLLLPVQAGGAEFSCTYLASDAMRTQLPETERRLNPAQHRDHVDVLYAAAVRRETFTSLRLFDRKQDTDVSTLSV